MLKANLRHKKGAFVSVAVLMLIICMSFTAFLSVKQNCASAVERALTQAGIPDLTVYYPNGCPSAELLERLEEHPSVKSVALVETVSGLHPRCGEKTDDSDVLLCALTENYRIQNESLSGYAAQTPPLQAGEIYISQGLGSKLDCRVGDTLTVDTDAGPRSFRVAGYVVEPQLGASNIGLKHAFISDEDFQTLWQDSKKAENTARIVYIQRMDEGVAENAFRRQLELDTHFLDEALFSISRAQSAQYTRIFPDIILSILLAFVFVLVLVVLIVMAHSISTGIEMDYTSLGVLKAQGFSNGQIREVFTLQYLCALLAGAVAGVALAVPLIRVFGDIFQPITAVPAENRVALLPSLLFVALVLAVSAVFVFAVTRKICRISPVRAIRGGAGDKVFRSRLQAPVSGRALSASLALRQLTANKRRYAGTVLVIALLMFFMLSASTLGRALDSKSALDAMGMPVYELAVVQNEGVEEHWAEIESLIERYSPIENRAAVASSYMTLNGGNYQCNIYGDDTPVPMEKGRAPRYDNEIAVTAFLAKELGVGVGDKVNVAWQGASGEYLITGFSVCANDLGLNFALPMAGAEKLGVELPRFSLYSLAEPAAAEEAAEAVSKQFGDLVSVEKKEYDQYTGMISLAVKAVTVVIYTLSVLVALVVVLMVCSRAFLREKRDIGICRALGFRASQLRLQFALRFLFISVLGTALGVLAGLGGTDRLLTVVMRLAGVSSMRVGLAPETVLLPAALLCLSFFGFAYLASRKIRGVHLQELGVE